MRYYVPLGLLCCVLTLLPVLAADVPKECKTKTAVQVKDNLYDFHYDSWVRAVDKDAWYFGRCVKADNPRQMYVEWPGPTIKGYTSKNDGELKNGVGAKTNQSKTEKSDLFYGAARKKTMGPFLAVDEKPAQIKSLDTMKSFAKMGLAPAPNSAEEEMNAKTIEVEVEFETSAFYNGGRRFISTLSWKNEKFDKDSPVQLKWADGGFVEMALKASSSSEEKYAARDLASLGKEKKGLCLVSTERPVLTHEVVTFLNREGKEIGAMTVAVYKPARK